jgi:hypothetical protein
MLIMRNESLWPRFAATISWYLSVDLSTCPFLLSFRSFRYLGKKHYLQFSDLQPNFYSWPL